MENLFNLLYEHFIFSCAHSQKSILKFWILAIFS